MEKAGTRAGLGMLLFIAVVAGIAFARGDIVRVAQPAEFELKRADLFNRNRVVFVRVLESTGVREIRTKAELDALKPNSLMAVRLKRGVTAMKGPVPGGGKKYLLPYRFQVTGGADAADDRYRTVAIVEGNGLVIDPATRRFRGSVRVGIEDRADPTGTPVRLPDKIPFLVTFSGGAAIPTDLSIGHTNLPYVLVRLDSAAPPDPSVLTVRATFDPEGLEIPVPVVRPGGELGAPETIPGLGFGFGTVVVQLPPHLVGHVKEVTLRASRGHLEPTRVSLSDTGSGEAQLRSEGIGDVTIEVLNDDLGIEPVRVRFALPWTLVVAIGIGAAVSGILYLKGGGKGAFLAGLLLGVVLGAAACAGISLADAPMPTRVTEVAAAVIASLPGFWKLRPKKE